MGKFSFPLVKSVNKNGTIKAVLPKNEIEDLQLTCQHMTSCMPGVTFTKTKYGGYFSKGSRKISCDIDYRLKSKDFSCFNIKKSSSGYGLKLHKSYSRMYTAIQESIRKGLGIK